MTIELQFEKGVKLLCEYMEAATKLTKPTLFHSIRVGTYLYKQNYSQAIVIAGLLHDIIEDTDVPQDLLEEEFGKEVVDMLLHNSKDTSIADQNARIDDLINRCASNGESSLIVKTADVLDNFYYFSRINNPKGVDYCVRNAQKILEFKTAHYTDEIFKKLEAELNKIQQK